MIFLPVKEDPDLFSPAVNGQAGFVEVPVPPVASDCGSPVLSAFAGFLLGTSGGWRLKTRR